MTSKLKLLLGTVLFWYLAAYWVGKPYLVPSPHEVLKEFAARPGLFIVATAYTALEAVIGLGVGVFVAVCMALLMFFLPATEKYVMPYAIALKSTPVVAVAPLFYVWFGPGHLARVLMSALISFFPVLQNMTDALKSVPEGARSYVAVLGASRYREFRLVRLQFAMPLFASALKVAAPLAVVGALVSELLGSDVGIGLLLLKSIPRADTAVMFAAVMCVVLVGWSFYGMAALLEAYLLKMLRMEREVYKQGE